MNKPALSASLVLCRNLCIIVIFVSDIAVFVLERDVKLQPTNQLYYCDFVICVVSLFYDILLTPMYFCKKMAVSCHHHSFVCCNPDKLSCLELKYSLGLVCWLPWNVPRRYMASDSLQNRSYVSCLRIQMVDEEWLRPVGWLFLVGVGTFTLMVGRQEGHPSCKKACASHPEIALPWEIKGVTGASSVPSSLRSSVVTYQEPTPKPRFFAKTVRCRNLGFSIHNWRFLGSSAC